MWGSSKLPEGPLNSENINTIDKTQVYCALNAASDRQRYRQRFRFQSWLESAGDKSAFYDSLYEIRDGLLALKEGAKGGEAPETDFDARLKFQASALDLLFTQMMTEAVPNSGNEYALRQLSLALRAQELFSKAVKDIEQKKQKEENELVKSQNELDKI